MISKGGGVYGVEVISPPAGDFFAPPPLALAVSHALLIALLSIITYPRILFWEQLFRQWYCCPSELVD